MPYFEYEGSKLYYEISGSGPPIVFVHGFAFDTRVWEPQKKYLEKEFTVVLVDLRGFGQSSLPTKEFTYFDDIAALLNFLNIEKCHLVGLSLGGGVVINFGITYPERTLSITSVSGVLGGYRRKYPEILSNIWKIGSESTRDAVATFQTSPYLAQTMSHPVAAPIVKQMMDDYHGWHWQNKDLSRPVNPSALSQLHMLQLPVLSIIGSEDAYDIVETSRVLVDAVTNAKRVVMDGLGHVPNLEDVDTFNEILYQFVTEISPA